MSKIWKIPLCVGTYYDGEEVFYAIPEDKNILGIRAILHPGFIKVIDYESYEALKSQNAELIAVLEKIESKAVQQVDVHEAADTAVEFQNYSREVLRKIKGEKS